MPSVDEELDRLFGLPLGEFVSGRNDLAKRLEDDEIRALPKPTVSAWTINQLSRVNRREVAALLDAGDELRNAQSSLLGGDDAGDALRDATLRERDAVTKLRKDARAVLTKAGRTATEATLDRIATTLRAAAVTDEGRELLTRGRLTVDLEPPGFDALEATGAARPRAPARKRDELAERRRQREQQQRRKELRERARAAERTARQAEREAEEARRIAVRARAEADALNAELES